jgi:DNA-directed RNA polymerase specialized sigma24 family protein
VTDDVGKESSGDARVRSLRGGADTADAALLDLRRDLVGWAARELGSMGRRVELDPESIVQSVLAREASRAIEEANDDRHLWSRLRLAVRHKIIDRKRALARRGNVEWTFDAAAREDATVEEIARDLPRRAFGEVVAAAFDDATKRRAIEAVLLEGRGTADVARECGMSDDALRAALSRARPALARELIEPLREFLPADEWRFCQEVVVGRQSIDAAAALVGWTPAEARDRAGDCIVAGLVAVYGPGAATWLPRVLGLRGRGPRSE